MARGVGNDKGALWGREMPIGDVDRDPLLALVLESIQQQRKVELITGSTKTTGVPLQCRELVVGNEGAFIEEATDQRRFAVIDRPAGQKTQEIFVLTRA